MIVLNEEFEQGHTPNTLIGYRVMRYDPKSNRAISGADSRFGIDLKEGGIMDYGEGHFLSNDPTYAKEYYGQHDNNVLIKVEFSPEDVLSGSLDDVQPEISVAKSRILGWETFVDPDLQEKYMTNFDTIFNDVMDFLKESEYRGNHTAPMSGSGSPAHDLADTYPDDLYSAKGAIYYGHYGHNDPRDLEAISIMRSLKGRPNRTVKIYRAIPKVLTHDEKISDLDKNMKYVMKNGRLPSGVGGNWQNPSQYYDWAYDELARLKSETVDEPAKMKINPGDWVGITRNYVKEHGESEFGRNNYRVLSKTVPARAIYTNGDSIQEWGYDPKS